jgi:hypothetical protein
MNVVLVFTGLFILVLFLTFLIPLVFNKVLEIHFITRKKVFFFLIFFLFADNIAGLAYFDYLCRSQNGEKVYNSQTTQMYQKKDPFAPKIKKTLTENLPDLSEYGLYYYVTTIDGAKTLIYLNYCQRNTTRYSCEAASRAIEEHNIEHITTLDETPYTYELKPKEENDTLLNTLGITSWSDMIVKSNTEDKFVKVQSYSYQHGWFIRNVIKKLSDTKAFNGDMCVVQQELKEITITPTVKKIYPKTTIEVEEPKIALPQLSQPDKNISTIETLKSAQPEENSSVAKTETIELSTPPTPESKELNELKTADDSQLPATPEDDEVIYFN